MAYYSKGTSVFTIPNPKNASYRVYYRSRTRYATKPVAKEPAPYKLMQCRVLSYPYETWHDSLNPNIMYYSQSPGVFAGTARANASSSDKALSKLKDEVYSKTSQLAATWAERKQSVDMIADRANQMRRAWRALRTGNFRRFKRELGLAPKRGENRWTRPTDAAKIWLEYWFGWSPLISDIYNAVDILQSQGPKVKAFGRATVRCPYQQLGRSSPTSQWDWQFDMPDWRFRTLVQAEVQVTNKNLFRADQLGLINPASVAWELIPFSFLVDWFIPVSDFLEEFTAYAGLSLTNTFTTRSRFGTGSQWVHRWVAPNIGPSQRTDSNAIYVERSLGLPTKSWPNPKAFKGFSVTRGATAISLLVTVLKPGRDLPQPRNRS